MKNLLLLCVIVLCTQLSFAASEIEVTIVQIASGVETELTSPVDFGFQTVGKTSTAVFRIKVPNKNELTNVTYQLENDETAFSISEALWSAQKTLSPSFRPTAAREFSATLTIRCDDAGVEPVTILLKGTGTKDLLQFGPVTVGNTLDQTTGITKLGLTGIQTARIEGANGAAYTIVNQIDTAVTVRFAPVAALNDYSAKLIISSTVDTEADVEVPLQGKGNDFPLDLSKWYYIQFLNGGKVIQENGNNNPLTAQTLVNDNPAQLWKLQQNGDYFIITSKNNENLRIHYKNAEEAYYATSTAYNASIPDGILSIHPEQSSATFYWGFTGQPPYGTTAFLMRPASESEGAPVVANQKNNGTNPAKTLLHFIKEGQSSGIDPLPYSGLKVYPNPASDVVFVELPDAASISVISITGQILKKTTTNANVVPIDISSLNAGIYFLKIEKASGLETVKLIKK